MNRYSILVACSLAGGAGATLAADLDLPLEPPSTAGGTRWEGFNIGVNGGAAWSPSSTATQVWFPPGFGLGLPPPGGPFNLSATGFMGGAQVGYNKQWGALVIGAESDFDFVGGSQAKKSAIGSYLGFPFAATQMQRLDSLGTIRGRVGYAPFDDLLIYGTAGLAFGETKLSSYLNFPTLGLSYAGSHSDIGVGFAAGAGLEYALTRRWSVGAEFLYFDLGHGHVVSPPNPARPDGETDTTAAFKGYTLRLGVNYEFDGTEDDPPAVDASQVATSGVTMRFGARAGVSTSNARLTLYDGRGLTRLSRLTYKNATAATSEIFGQIDENSGIFLKGYAGIGKEFNGTLQDEDFPPVTAPYSSTNSPQKDGRLGYATADAGYYGLVSSWYKFGGFAGYHYLDERFNAFGCTQTAGNPDICAPGQVDPANLTIS
ncbi:MAG: porin family protein, partial [Acetobacteraceae bacterium]|nr:porin family protein [Acetobacteraceae bacterium]